MRMQDPTESDVIVTEHELTTCHNQDETEMLGTVRYLVS